ncbi:MULTISPECIES: DUF1127 domain-containing protein [Vibrio]|uniref:DUF1127 domain-containing protein n=1 Tax=Vibrio TaxID=662 RepID=UPI00036CAA26|nr:MULTISPECIES: DUF1127 domain-containing protein [Vibrio]AIU67743.1 hypothetical protein JV59_36395 [Vibrio coralliilyticus]ARC91427.1 hypothetical protein B6A42_03785 [Vibrio coralliilyticus]KFI09236.1 hypothetical protein IX95_25530 [Vibrio sp. B183]MCM5509955.1 DUF1127 domain-containing protein [Vibrio sp. SCSIO 43169]MDE3900809.1 DUF1127 domain-containing protein [Vibrio sp. CC007]
METTAKSPTCSIDERLSLRQKFLTKIKRWRRNYRTRRQLNHLSGHMLRDIGVEHEEAARESRRPFWDD